VSKKWAVWCWKDSSLGKRREVSFLVQLVLGILVLVVGNDGVVRLAEHFLNAADPSEIVEGAFSASLRPGIGKHPCPASIEEHT